MKTISVIIPAYMEAKNIKAAVQNTVWALSEARVDDYEILIIDCLKRDGTHDGTPEIAESLAKENSRIKVFHNSYINLGTKYWMGVDRAKFNYVVLVAGHNKLSRETLRDMLYHLGEADILTSYAVNTEIRPLVRRVVSWLFTFLINFSTGLTLRYYNGACIHKTDVVKQIKERNTSFAYMAELLAQLIKKGYSYKEIPFTLQKKEGGKSSAFKWGNLVSVIRTMFVLFWKYRISWAGRGVVPGKEER